jgi:2-hydroxychromene-2-carboxylate isomerase
MQRLVFYCDPISPYSYFSSQLLPALCARHRLSLHVQPVLFAGLLNASGGKGPAEIPLKRRYIFLDCVRLAQEHGLPFCTPPKHPFNPLLSLRAVTSIQDDVLRFTFMKSLVDSAWGKGLDISDPKVVESVAINCSIDPVALFHAANTEETKQALRKNTEDAVVHGVFGVPTVRAGDEIFWGSDRLGQLDKFLQGKLVVDHDKLDKMLDIPRGSDRKTFRNKEV